MKVTEIYQDKHIRAGANALQTRSRWGRSECPGFTVGAKTRTGANAL